MDIGNATLLVIPGMDAQLDTDHVLLQGGARADVFVDEDGDTLVQVGADAISPMALVAAVLRSPRLNVVGSQLQLAVVADRGHDRLVMSRDRSQLFVHTRHASSGGGPNVAFVADRPTQDRDGRITTDVLTSGSVLIGRALATAGAVTVTHIHSGFDNAAATPDAGARAAALAAADIVIPAWGPQPPARQNAVEAVIEELQAARDAGTRVLMISRNGDISTAGRPPQPNADLRHAPDVRLVDAPAAWLWGGPLD